MIECINCKDSDHEHCLFDPPYNICECCTGKGYKMDAVEAMKFEAQQIVGSDGGFEFT